MEERTIRLISPKRPIEVPLAVTEAGHLRLAGGLLSAAAASSDKLDAAGLVDRARRLGRHAAGDPYDERGASAMWSDATMRGPMSIPARQRKLGVRGEARPRCPKQARFERLALQTERAAPSVIVSVSGRPPPVMGISVGCLSARDGDSVH